MKNCIDMNLYCRVAANKNEIFQGKKHCLEILDFDESDRGKYVVRTDTDRAYTEAVIDLAIPPSLYIPEEHLTVNSENKSDIVVQYKASPKPEIKIYKVIKVRKLELEQ